ncbi:MAG TPA: hypothetical protein VGI40_00505 [Pirellulaceae bacterium]|jgi:hypothetical protein
MNTFETSALVEAEGQVRVAGVPFEPGTKVEVTITRVAEEGPPIEDAVLTAARAKMRELFRSVKGFRMTPKLSREELYDRRSFR